MNNHLIATWLFFRHLLLLSLVLLCLIQPALAMPSAHTVTRAAGIEALTELKQSYRLPAFRLGGSYAFGEPARYHQGGEGGVLLESRGIKPLQLGYIAVGTPRRNAAGEIINAIVVNPYYSGDASLMYHYWYADQAGNDYAQGAVIGPGKLIDTRKYYVVFVDSIGLWGASKPSDGLGPDFPEYSILDMVQANYRLLKDQLKIGRVLLAMGPSMGGMQSYAWAALHPEYVGAILPIGGSAVTQTDPIVRDLFQLMSAAIQSDPIWRQTQGYYYDRPKAQHPNQGVEFGWSLLAHTGTSLNYQFEQGWERKQQDTFSWTPAGQLGSAMHAKSRDFDANDLLYRNRSLFSFDIHQQLPKIRAKTLIVHIENDQWIHVANARRAAEAIPGAQVLSFADPLAHYAIFKAPNHFQSQLQTFLSDLE